MQLLEQIREKEQIIIDRWLDLTLDTYPAYSTGFMKNQRNRFANPVGNTIRKTLSDMVKILLADELEVEKLTPCLDEIIKIRSVQDFSPAQAVGFVFFLKKVIREEFYSDIISLGLFDELLLMESRIDKLGLCVFDLYLKHRERVYEIRAHDAMRRVQMLLARMNRMDRKISEENI